MNPVGPTLAGFTAFVRTFVGINSTVLPDASPAIPVAYGVALEIVNPQLAQIGGVNGAILPPGTPSIYALAVYNLGVDNLINYAPDVQPPVPYSAPGNDNEAGLPYFAYFRNKWKIYDFVAGVVQSTSDEGTAVSFVVQKAAEDFKLADLQNLKTPYGRQYLAIAQRVGSLWGLTT